MCISLDRKRGFFKIYTRKMRAHFVPEVLADIVRSFLMNARACNVTIWKIRF